MSILTRARGDNYPIQITFKDDNGAVDLSGSVIKFSYKNSTEAVLSITGTNTVNLGEVEFIPSTSDFLVVGVYSYDVQRVAGGYTTTHLKGTLILDGDVTV